MVNAIFYDIESLRNLFTLAAYDHMHNRLDIYYLLDNPEIMAAPGFRERLCDKIREKNVNFVGEHGEPGEIVLHDLMTEEANIKLATDFGYSVCKWINNPNAQNVILAANGYDCYAKRLNKPPYIGKDLPRFVCDTDPEYISNPEKYPYLMGYNSYNYDTTMLAIYLDSVISYCNVFDEEAGKMGTARFDVTLRLEDENHVTADRMRQHNDNIFRTYKDNMASYLTSRDMGSKRYNNTAHIIRRNMLLSGRHLDVARLNEKQRKVGLKRLLGMLGYQILESDKLGSGQDTIENEEQLIDLIAYNVSDVVNLKELFYHPMYQAQFELKKGLLATYPELVYDRKFKIEQGEEIPTYEPNINPTAVRPDRLCIDASSAQFATKCLCPYGHLTDIPAVSFDYPHCLMCKPGEKPRNILNECIEFLNGLYPRNNPDFKHIWDEFDNVIKFYRSIEGKNFNDTDSYEEERLRVLQEDPGYYNRVYKNAAPPTGASDYKERPQDVRAWRLSAIPKLPTCIPYYDGQGKATSAFALFSTGGIHGAEYNKELYEYHLSAYETELAELNEIKAIFNDDAVACRKAKKATLADGREVDTKNYLKSGRKIADSEWRDVTVKKPQLFRKSKKANDNSTNLNPKYAFTSAAKANHEDFTSYYPNLLRQMRAFYNPGIGRDRYGDIFYQKQDYGKKMKDKSLPEAERNQYRILREGTKLILNSASGAGDATFDNNIRVNNLIISMRIIGQLFSWHIGQAQAYAGATIISTNTDGLYSVMEENLNNQILERESAGIGVEIEPEPLYLISKDSNNRIELDKDGVVITGASGGTLACRLGPDPGKALAHPAIIDWALAEYLTIASQNYKGTGLDKRFDEEIGLNILKSAEKKFAPEHYLRMFQNVIASSPGTYTFICGYKDGEEDRDRIVLQHYNRVFITKDKTPGAIHLESAAARVITPAMRNKRSKEPQAAQVIHESKATNVLIANGVDIMSEISDKDIMLRKVTNIDPEWYMLVCNESIKHMSPERIKEIASQIDLQKYLTLLKNAFENNWMNHLPSNGDFDFNPEETEDEEEA